MLDGDSVPRAIDSRRLQPPCESSTDVQDAAGLPSRFRSPFAANVDDAGFWPVTRRPAVIANGCQSCLFSKTAPSRSSSSSTRNGTTWVSLTSSSSPFVKPVTCLPFTSVAEHEIRGRERLQPEPRLTAGIAQNVVRQYLGAMVATQHSWLDRQHVFTWLDPHRAGPADRPAQHGSQVGVASVASPIDTLFSSDTIVY
jgi:hypothetical protein